MPSWVIASIPMIGPRVGAPTSIREIDNTVNSASLKHYRDHAIPRLLDEDSSGSCWIASPSFSISSISTYRTEVSKYVSRDLDWSRQDPPSRFALPLIIIESQFPRRDRNVQHRPIIGRQHVDKVSSRMHRCPIRLERTKS